MKRTTALVIALVLTIGPRVARGDGGEPFNFLFLDANARAVGLGGAYTAQAVDANALLYNPAGLSKISGHELTFMHNSHVQGVFQDYLGYASPRGWGLTLNYLSFGDIQRTTIDNPSGTGLDRTGSSDIMFGAGYGWAYSDSLNFGAAGKFIQETIDRASAQGYALDLGILFDSEAFPDLRLGLALQNIGPTVRFLDVRESLPLNVRAGAAYDFLYRDKENTVSLDLMKERSESVLAAFGAETHLIPEMPLRLGFGTRGDVGPNVTAGIGWRYKNFMFDYAFAPMGVLGAAHRFSVTARWEGGILLKKSQEDVKPLVRRSRRLDAGDFDIVDEFIESGMLDAAQAELQALAPHIQSDDLKRVRYHERMGEIAYRRHDILKARSHYLEALRIAIQLSLAGGAVADAYAGVARCLVKDGEHEKALQFFLKALQAGPSSRAQKEIKRDIQRVKSRKTLKKRSKIK